MLSFVQKWACHNVDSLHHCAFTIFRCERIRWIGWHYRWKGVNIRLHEIKHPVTGFNFGVSSKIERQSTSASIAKLTPSTLLMLSMQLRAFSNLIQVDEAPHLLSLALIPQMTFWSGANWLILEFVTCTCINFLKLL